MAPPERSELIAGGGETAKLIRELDWAQTPLGPLETWPQSLLTSVSLCLASNLPISIVWGPERTQIYNDAYRSLCGARHPHALGQRFDARRLSAGPALGEALERASAGQTTSLPNERVFLERNGSLEEAFFGFSFGPIRNEAGGVGGIFHTGVERTQQTLAERRLGALREVAERCAGAVSPAAVSLRVGEVLAAHALDVPFALLYWVDADGQSASLAASAGLASEAAARPARIELAEGRPALWPLAEALERGNVVQVDSLAQRFGPLACGPYTEPPQSALVLPLDPPGAPRPVALLVAGISARRPLDDAYRTFYEMLRQAVSLSLGRTRDPTRASDAKFSTAFENSPLALTISALDDGRLLEVNEGFERLSGYSREMALGRTPDELGLWLEPELRVAGLAKLRAGEFAPELEARFRARNGEERIGVIRASLVEVDGRACVLSTVSDVTERKHTERVLTEQTRLLELIASGRPLDECLAAVCDAVPGLAPHARGCLRLGEDEQGGLAGTGAPEARKACTASIDTGVCHATPVLGEDGRRLGSFVLCFDAPREPSDADRRLGELGAHLASIALERDRAAASLRENQERLAVLQAATTRLQEASTHLTLRDDVEALYAQILNAATSIMHADQASLQGLHPERGPSGELLLLAELGFDEESARLWKWVSPSGASACAMALRTGERVVVSDVERSDFMQGSEDLAAFRRIGIRAVQTTPLFSRSGNLLGMLSTHWRKPHRPSDHSLRLLDVLARQASDLIERSQAAAALRASEERHRSLTRMLSSVVWTTDGAGAFVTEQAEWAAFTGQSFEQHRGWGWLEAIHPEDRQAIDALWRKALAARDRYESRGRIWHAASGEYRHFVARGAPLFDVLGDVREWIGTITDVHEQEQADADAEFLVRLGERTSASEDAAELMAEVVRAVGEYLHVSRCFFAQVDEPSDRWTIERDYHGTLLSIAGEYRVSDYDPRGIRESREGRTRVYEDTVSDPRSAATYATRYAPLGARAAIIVPLRRAGRWVSNLSVTADRPRRWQPREVALLEAVAERTWSTVEKLRLAAELRESEERFRSMADQAPVMVWVSGPDGRCTYLSRSWYEFTGQSAETGLGVGWFDAIHPEDRPRVERERREARAEGEAFRLEYRLRRRDGTFAWALDAARPRFSGAGELLGYVGSAIDLSDRKQAEEALRTADRRKDEFLAMLAHELRNPLAPIRNAAHVLRHVTSGEETQRWASEVVERQTQHLSRLVDDLLDVSRITQGKITLQREPLELASILHLAVEAALPLVEARGQQLTLVLPEEPLQVRGDLTRLVQCVGNLLNNAAKFSEAGGRIQLEAAAEGRDAVIRVRDDGIGLGPDLLPHVFDLFTQADRSLDRSQGGLGIGLTLVKTLIEMHGGTVEALSEGPGRGSEFVVRLPALDAEGEHADTPAGAPAPSAAHPLRVLLVEDHADSAEMMAFLLQLAGHEVRTAGDGRTALELARAFQPQVVLCDIGLPGMNGYDVAAALRAEPAFAETRLIAISGYGRDEDRRRSQQAGFDYHLTKPVPPEALGALLDSLRAEEVDPAHG